MERLEAFAERRRANFKRLYSALERYTDRLILPKATPGSEPSWFAFPLTVRPEARFTREDIVRCLEEHQVETRPLFAGNVLRHPAFQGIQSRVVGELRNSDMVLERSFFIGVYPGLTDSQVDYMLEVIGWFMREH